jgi:hypothetical protein
MVAEHVERMQQRSEELSDKLSFGTYFGKQIRDFVVNVAGAGGGLAAGWGIGGLFKSKPFKVGTTEILEHFGWVGAAAAKSPNKAIGAGIGYVVGSLGAVTVLGYERWAKGEAERLAVDEINHDIAESKLRMDPELMRENATLRDMLAHEKGKAAEHAKSQHAKAEHPKSGYADMDDATEDHAKPAHRAAQAEHVQHELVGPHHEVSMRDAKHDGALHADHDHALGSRANG